MQNSQHKHRWCNELHHFCETAAIHFSGAHLLAGQPQNRKKQEVEAAEMEAVVEGTDEGATLEVTTKKSKAKADSKFPPFGRCPQPSLCPELLYPNMLPDSLVMPFAA